MVQRDTPYSLLYYSSIVQCSVKSPVDIVFQQSLLVKRREAVCEREGGFRGQGGVGGVEGVGGVGGVEGVGGVDCVGGPGHPGLATYRLDLHK